MTDDPRYIPAPGSTAPPGSTPGDAPGNGPGSAPDSSRGLSESASEAPDPATPGSAPAPGTSPRQRAYARPRRPAARRRRHRASAAPRRARPRPRGRSFRGTFRGAPAAPGPPLRDARPADGIRQARHVGLPRHRDPHVRRALLRLRHLPRQQPRCLPLRPPGPRHHHGRGQHRRAAGQLVHHGLGRPGGAARAAAAAGGTAGDHSARRRRVHAHQDRRIPLEVRARHRRGPDQRLLSERRGLELPG